MGTLRVPRYPSPAFRPRFPAQTDESGNDEEAPEKDQHQLHGFLRSGADEGIEANSGKDKDDDDEHGPYFGVIASARQSIAEGVCAASLTPYRVGRHALRQEHCGA